MFHIIVCKYLRIGRANNKSGKLDKRLVLIVQSRVYI